MKLDIQNIRKDFPILNETVNGKPLVYFDNGATSQKPQVVIDAEKYYYEHYNANIHRGVHTLSQKATDEYEIARQKVQKHLNAEKLHEIIFTAGTTFGVNLVANGFVQLLQPNDEVIISYLEHHSNIVPWQFACERSGATLKVIPMTKEGILDIEAYKNLLTKNTKVVAVNHVSNALGTINPVEKITALAHEVGAAVLIDGAQAVPHLKPDVQKINCDFYVFSGHKMCGPTGTGVLYGKENWLNTLPPYQGGGEMIEKVSFEKTTYACLPHKFEAGTPNIAGGIALGVAIDYLNQIGFDIIEQHERELLEYVTQRLSEIEEVEIYANHPHKAAVVSFNCKGIHPYDIGSIVDKLGIAVRTGHHCTQPIMDYFEIPGTVRASFAFYNTKEEIDVFVDAVKKAVMMLK
ncbi:aminotransferase class V-fold PLP-dependent enzyme [Capnocytophaga sp. ARDL2]|uniref:aminotransferase class V-fold PLP-dependent enzyme n=1 Tax=Capnocytophaga sp. ARDL2 TaxID=3238809 RepID=UPI003555EC73